MSEKAVTILQQEYTDEDMAAVGRAFMEAIEQARLADPWVKGWAPAQCPSEIIFDLINHRDDTLAHISERIGEADASFRKTLRIERGCHLNEVRLKDQYRSRALAAEEALKQARARIEYLGAACTDPKHFQANIDIFLPKIDAVLAAVSSPVERSDG